MFFALVYSPGDDPAILRVSVEDGGGRRAVEVPVCPDTLGQDVLDCVSQPPHSQPYLVELWGSTESIIRPEENLYARLLQYKEEADNVSYVVRFGHPLAWSPHPQRHPGEGDVVDDDDDEEGRRALMRRGMRENTSQPRVPALPGGGDMSMAELQAMAGRQQQQLENQQQALVAKEQRLKFLKQQEARQAARAAEQDQLRRLRSKMEAQELKLKKLRALRGQVEQHKASNGNLSSELDTVKAMFNEKEKELTMAVAKVEQLTKQLEEIRKGKLNGINGNNHSAAALELEKLRKELLLRNKLNEQQNNKFQAQKEKLAGKREDVSRMDRRIAELQQRVKKKQMQQTLASKTPRKLPGNSVAHRPSGPNVAAIEPYIQHAPKETTPTSKDDLYSTKGFNKQDPKYQSLPPKTQFTSGEKGRGDESLAELNNNNVGKNVQETKPPSAVTPVTQSMPNGSVQQGTAPSTVTPGQPGWVKAAAAQRSGVVSSVANMAPRPFGTTYGTSGNRGPSTVQMPVISISEEERQAGSGQSSPASSDSSHASQGRGKPIPPALTPRAGSALSAGQGMGANGVPVVSKPGNGVVVGPGAGRGIHHLKPGGEALSGAEGKTGGKFPSPLSPISSEKGPEGKSPQSHEAAGGKLVQESPKQDPGSPQAASTPVSQGSGNPPESNSPPMAAKSAPAIRYAPKSVIANTYMGRLGSSAMEKYSRNLELLYKGVDNTGGGANAAANEKDKTNSRTGKDQEEKSGGDAAPSTGNSEEKTAFTQGGDTPEGSGSHRHGVGHTHFGLVGAPHQYPDNTSDKVSYKPNTPKNIRRRHSDSEEDLAKFLHRGHPHSSHHGSGEAHHPMASLPEVPGSSNTSAPAPSSLPAPKSPSAAGTSPGNAPVVKRKKTNLKGENSRKSTNRVSFDPLALLLDASLEGELDLVMRCAREVQDVSASNDEGITALHNAICAGHYEIVKFLVEFGCDVNSPDSDGWTPLHCAASCNNILMVKFLVEHGACIFATTISDHETAAEKCEEDEADYDGCSDYLYSVQEKLGIMNGGEAYAVFDYQAENEDELSFRIGDKLTILRKGDEKEKEWWWARRGDREGYVPRNLLGLYPRVLQEERKEQ